jgi:tetratricopeptide (TPR) repeat protein
LKFLMSTKRDKEILIKYARALFEIGKFAEALNTAEEIKSKEPENIEAQMIIGKVKTAQKKYDDAVETYKVILYIDQNYGPALCERANIYLIQGKYQWAQTFYERALKVDPKNALVYLGLAKLAKQQKDYAGYTDHLEKARKLDPNNKDIQDELKTVKR